MSPSTYDIARELLAKEIRQLEGVLTSLDWMEAHGVSPDAIIARLSTPARRNPAINGDGRVLNIPAQLPLPDAIDAVLGNGGKLTVEQIVQALEQSGRVFPPRARKDSLVRGTLNRCAGRLGWHNSRGKPRKWWKIQGEATAQA